MKPLHPTLPLKTRVMVLEGFDPNYDGCEGAIISHIEMGYMVKLDTQVNPISIWKHHVVEKPAFCIKDDEVPVCIIVNGRIISMEIFNTSNTPYYHLESQVWSIAIYTSCEISTALWNPTFKHWYIQIL
jgi:hypothetical protein